VNREIRAAPFGSVKIAHDSPWSRRYERQPPTMTSRGAVLFVMGIEPKGSVH
jgi:hypothetical protein